MNARLAILCPGQGGQHAGMFDLARGDAKAAAFLDACGLDQLLAQPLAEVLGNENLLFANRQAQPLLVAAQLALWQALASPISDVFGQPALVAGYSIGELASYGVAGVLQPLPAVRMAAQRAQLMDEAQACGGDPDQTLMSVGGMLLEEAQAILNARHAHLAIQTAEDSLVAGGARQALQAAEPLLQAAGARTGWLPVSIASHTPLMQAAQAPFLHLLAQADLQAPSLPLLAGVTAQIVTNAQQAEDLLAQQLSHPILWSACMDACAEHGITVALELGPGSALSRMLRERHPHIECRSVSDFRSVQGALSWLQRQCD
ncbi:acyltransferase domain-containing protein [Herbaspirillum lusitanum]|uniref:Acyltransferase domain-containing protein n=1 Tax=Herbaspirillum lusitanum TaxID=213312 RepID=A0ABW9AD48_9BURK